MFSQSTCRRLIELAARMLPPRMMNEKLSSVFWLALRKYQTKERSNFTSSMDKLKTIQLHLSFIVMIQNVPQTMKSIDK